MSVKNMFDEQTIQDGKDLLHEVIIQDSKILDLLLINTSMKFLNVSHATLREPSPVAAKIIDKFLSQNIYTDNQVIKQYYFYLQKICSIGELYGGIWKDTLQGFENHNLMVITFHKLQNIMNIAQSLLIISQPETQELLYLDIYKFNTLIRLEFSHNLELYPTYSSQISLALFQIYQDLIQTEAEMDEFRRNSNLKLPIFKHEIDEQLLGDFLTFTSQIQLMSPKVIKPLHIPTKNLPCGGREDDVIIQLRKFHSLRHTLG
ncbi:hypothetical protein pb186bvf_012617 [Paramecium bursaria]